MSAMMSHQPPKEDEEEDDEEQGEEFVFEDSEEEEKTLEDSKDITSDCVKLSQMTKNESSETPGGVLQRAADGTQLIKSAPPAGPESTAASNPSTDVPAAESPSWASAAEPDASARVRDELPAALSAEETLSDSGGLGKESVKESYDSRDISEDTEAQTAEVSEVIYDDVPSEEPLSPDEDMIYEDVQKGSGPLEANNGWSSSEFESYDEQSDNDTKLPARSKVQQFMKAARSGTKDGLERTKIAVMRKVPFLQRKDQTEEEDDAGYLDVAVSDVKHPPPQLSPMPEGLTNHQVQLTAARSHMKMCNSYIGSQLRTR